MTERMIPEEKVKDVADDLREMCGGFPDTTATIEPWAWADRLDALIREARPVGDGELDEEVSFTVSTEPLDASTREMIHRATSYTAGPPGVDIPLEPEPVGDGERLRQQVESLERNAEYIGHLAAKNDAGYSVEKAIRAWCKGALSEDPG